MNEGCFIMSDEKDICPFSGTRDKDINSPVKCIVMRTMDVAYERLDSTRGIDGIELMSQLGCYGCKDGNLHYKQCPAYKINEEKWGKQE